MSPYDYEELLAKAKENKTQENLQNLVDWLSFYDSSSWNGEYYEADDLRIYPCYTEIDDEFVLIGYMVC